MMRVRWTIEWRAMGRAYEPDEYSREVADQALIRGVVDALVQGGE